MKFRVEVDCTPEEARTFVGLPDLQPMQKAVMARMETRMLEAADAFSPEGMLRMWLSLVPEGQMRTMTESFFSAFRPRPRPSSESSEPNR